MPSLENGLKIFYMYIVYIHVHDVIHSPEPATGLGLSGADVGADLLHMPPLLLQDVSTGDMDPLLEVVEVYLRGRERGREGGR